MKTTTIATRKITASTGKANRSKTCTKLWPKKATTTWMPTTISRQTTPGRSVSELSASAPLTLLTANQPIPAITELITAGRALPQKPNAEREATICGRPVRGPIVER